MSGRISHFNTAIENMSTVVKSGFNHADIIMKHMRNDRKKEENDCDVMLKVGDVSINVHQPILITFSDYFDEFFKDSRPETETITEITVTCPGQEKVSPIAVHSIIDFMYDEVFDLDEDTVDEVLLLCKHWRVDTLMEKVSSTMQKLCTVDNWLKTYQTAEKYDFKALLDHCLNVYEALNPDITSISFNEFKAIINNLSATLESDGLLKIVHNWVMNMSDESQRNRQLQQLMDIVNSTS